LIGVMMMLLLVGHAADADAANTRARRGRSFRPKKRSERPKSPIDRNGKSVETMLSKEKGLMSDSATRADVSKLGGGVLCCVRGSPGT
jgi:hypothetical protein